MWRLQSNSESLLRFSCSSQKLLSSCPFPGVYSYHVYIRSCYRVCKSVCQMISVGFWRWCVLFVFWDTRRWIKSKSTIRSVYAKAFVLLWNVFENTSPFEEHNNFIHSQMFRWTVKFSWPQRVLIFLSVSQLLSFLSDWFILSLKCRNLNMWRKLSRFVVLV
jgi:hypothetical protein